ncbi:MAG TPA: hypothetical protein VFO45_01630 [Sphingomicrobium sp.]|nr:hypothetical protein [Sphingomicrobium sp.]
MVRLGSAALLALSLPAVAWSNPPDGDRARSFHLPSTSFDHRFAADGAFGQSEIAPNTTFGFGMFGLKMEKSPLRPATGSEIDARKQRRAAVGFSLRF